MKKVKQVLLGLVMCLPLLVNAKAEEIYIKDITLVGKSGEVVEKTKPSYEGMEVNFDLKFKELGDSAKYQIMIENKSNIEYEIQTQNKFNESEYVEYTYTFEDNNNLVKASSTKVMIVELKYLKEVPIEKALEGTYTESNTLSINMANEEEEELEEGTVENPNTGVFTPWVILISLGVIALGIYLGTKNKAALKKISLFLITIGTCLPFVSAAEKLYIKVNTKVEIVIPVLKEFKLDCREKTYYYEENMNWLEFIDSKYNVDKWKIKDIENLRYESRLGIASVNDDETDSSASLPSKYLDLDRYVVPLYDAKIQETTYRCYVNPYYEDGDGPSTKQGLE